MESSDFPTHMVGSYLSNSAFFPSQKGHLAMPPPHPCPTHSCKPFPTKQSLMSTESPPFHLELALGHSQSKEAAGAGS